MQEIAECKSVHIVCVPEVFAVADYIFVHRILVKTGERAGDGRAAVQHQKICASSALPQEPQEQRQLQEQQTFSQT